MRFTTILGRLKKNLLPIVNLRIKSFEEWQCEKLLQALYQNTSLSTFSMVCYKNGPSNMGDLIRQLTSQPYLQSLSLIGCCNDSFCSLLAYYLYSNVTLGYLNLTENFLTEISLLAISYLFSYQPHLAIQTLDLSFNHLTENSGNLLAQIFINNNKLKIISLNYNPLTDAGISSLVCGLLYNYSLHTLNLKGTQLNDSGASALGFLLKNQQGLVKLDLSDNAITDLGAAYLAEALSNNTCLLKLNLNSNKITAMGAQIIGQALCINTHLICLGLGENQINNTGLLALGQMLMVNRTLLYLNLTYNLITEDCVEFLTQSLIVSQILVRVNLYNENLPQTFFRLLEQIIQKDKAISPAMCYKTAYSNAVEKHLHQLAMRLRQCAYLLKAARIIIQARNSPASLLQQIPIEIQEHIINCLEQQPLTTWQRRNIWEYAQEKPQYGHTKHHFLRHTFFNNKPIYPLQIMGNLSNKATI